MSEGCDLCGLPTPDPPITGDGAEGAFCCEGCLQVAGVVDAADGPDEAAVRERARTGEPARQDAGPAEDLAEAFLAVEGMHCTTCEAFVGLQGESTEGIVAVDASYATDTVRVTYDPDLIAADALPAALTGYGYTARERGRDGPGGTTEDRDTRQRLVVGIILGMLVMPWYVFFLYPSYVGIETGILSADMTTTAGLYVPMGIVAMLSALVVGFTGWPILRGAWVSLRTRRPNMDLLLSVAILSAFGYSLVALAAGSVHLYFDVAIAIVLVVTAGGYYEGRLKRAATERLAELTAAQVREARRQGPDGETETVDVDDLGPGDHVLVRPGERVPVDGTVHEGTAAVDEAIVTGESLPVTKSRGDEVVGGAVVTDSALVITVGDDGESTLDRITNVLWAVQSERPGVQRFADRLATVFVPLVLVLAVAVAGWHLLVGAPVSAVVLGGLTVLVAACPCAMGLATPLATAAGLRDALRNGLVVTSASVFEAAPDVDCLVFDKTGTLTTGEMAVQGVTGDRAAVAAAAALERRSSHPVADAIVDHVAARADGGAVAAPTEGKQADDEDDPFPPIPATVEGFERHPGEGISGQVGDGAAAQRVVVGTPTLVESRCGAVPADLADAAAAAREGGQVPVLVGVDGDPAAVVTVGDRERDEWADVLGALDDREIYVLTGDDAAATARFRDHPAVEQVFAGVPPDGKVATVERLAADRTVAMVGDGTNDAPALAAADLGIALEGTARAAEAADVAVLDGDLADVPRVFDLAAATRRRIHQNVGWALCYNGVALPLAAIGALNPLLAALAMAGSSILVVTNSRRPLLPTAHDGEK